MKTDPDLEASVIIPIYGDWAPLATCLGRLAAQTASSDRYEIIVANNNPSPDIPPDLCLPPNARVIWEPRPGSYAARNAGIREARGAVLFFTDSDCRPAPTWIEAGLAALAADPTADRLGGAIEIVPAGRRWTIPEHHDRIFGMKQRDYVGRGYAATANLVVRREVFDRVGPFDEALYSCGDKEWNLRATAAGSGIAYAEAVVVEHPARASYAELARKRRRVVGGLIALKGGPCRRRIPPPKLLLPPFKRILRAPGLKAHERVQLGWLGYRLRLSELWARLALEWQIAPPRRE